MTLRGISKTSYHLPNGIKSEKEYLNWLELNGYGYLESVMTYNKGLYGDDWTKMGENVFTEPSSNTDHDGEIYKWIEETFWYKKGRQKFLNVGSNVGYMDISMAKRKAFDMVVGMDASMMLVGYARMLTCKFDITGVRFDHGDALHMTYADKEFDTVYCQHVLEHLPSVYEALKEQSRVGKVVCGFVPYREISENAEHIYTFTEESLGNVMRELFEHHEMKLSSDGKILGYGGWNG